MKHDPVGKLMVAVLVVILAAVAWLSRNLDSPAVERAAEWPLVGPVFDTLRTRYVEAERPPVTAEPPAAEPQQPPPTGRGGSLPGDGFVWVRAAVELLATPQEGATAVATVAEIARLPVLEQRGDWYKVVHGSRVGWLLLPDYGEGAPPLGSDPDPPRPLPGRSADPELVDRARELLAAGGASGELGPYQLVTDVGDAELLRLLDRVAAGIESAYTARYGVRPIDRPRETVVLFARERDYRAFQDGLERLEGLPASGLVSRGVSAGFAGGRGHAEIATTVVHELTHLLNRRALGPALPPWLDEGLAADLAHSEIGLGGELRTERLGGSYRSLGSTRIVWGGLAALAEIERSLAGERSWALRDVTALDWRSFVSQAEMPSYPLSGLFMRFLVETPPRAERLRAFLRGVAAGEPAEAERLRAELGNSWSELDEELAAWVLRTAAAGKAAADESETPQSRPSPASR